MYQVTSIKHSNSDLILHINVAIIAWLVPQLNASTFFFTLARFFSRQAVACPSPLLSTSKPFLAILTISSHQVTSCIESSIHVLLSFSFQFSKLQIWDQSICNPLCLINQFIQACFHIVHGNPTIIKPLHELHLHCCLVLELDYLHNNTLFWLSLSTYEITYYLSTLSKRVSPLITLSFNHPKPTKGLDALSISPFFGDWWQLD